MTPSSVIPTVKSPSQPGDWRWLFWPVVPLYPYGQRRTRCREVVPETIWTFEQVQGIFYVVVPIRMTVVRLAQGGLLVYAPVAPTPECVQLMRQLEARYGPVRYILMTTATGIEHKVFVGPFARRFPMALVYTTPHQWSYPLNLPLPWLGLPRDRTQTLPAEASQAPFADEFDYAILGPIPLGLGPFAELALFHRSSRTLLLTDSLVKVPLDPPKVLELDPYPLLFHSRDRATDDIIDSPENRRKGWQRIALFAFYFQPASLGVPTLIEAMRAAGKASDRSRQAYWGLYPFRWQADWQDSFMALHGGGRPFVAPVLQTLIFSRGPEQISSWLDQVARWQFERVIPCHLEAPFPFSPTQLKTAFSFLTNTADSADASTLAEANLNTQPDFAFLRELETGLIKRGITPPRPESQA
jgi:hypothetical protein